MGSLLRNGHLIRICRVVMGVVFIAAALAKIGDVAAFGTQIHNFRMMPIGLENLVAMTLPWIELLAGLSLLLGIRPRSGGLIVTVLMAFFLVAVAVALGRGLDIECGCFGTADGTRVGISKLSQNLVMLILAFIGTQAPAAEPKA